MPFFEYYKRIGVSYKKHMQLDMFHDKLKEERGKEKMKWRNMKLGESVKMTIIRFMR